MDDYGHYGKGLTGYVHYTEAQKRSGGGGGGGGCFMTVLIILGVIVLIGGLVGSCS